MKRSTLQRLVRFLMKILTDTRYEGMEHVPVDGALIITTNHMSRIDIPVLFQIPPRPDITALVADNYKNAFFIGWFTRTAKAIYIDRTKADFSAFRDAFEALKDGRALGISPEGTRSRVAALAQAKPGTVMLAAKAGVPVVPVGITGTESAIRNWMHLRRAHIIARFGPPLIIPSIPREGREEFMQKYTDEIMCRIAALLPEGYRGYYKGFPRVKELRDEWGLSN
jgi:1-acyl-sn-glycerol-3-phosphate acyltransferase